MLSIHFIPCILIYCQTYVNHRVGFNFERFKDGILRLQLAGTWPLFIVSYTLPPPKKKINKRTAIQDLDLLYQNALLTF